MNNDCGEYGHDDGACGNASCAKTEGDDIVRRLRERAMHLRDLTGAAGKTTELLDQAADEIDRPRPLTFDEFRQANRVRCLRWHPKGIGSWSDSDWITAIVGELGELAGLIKMRNRERDGLPGNKFSPTDRQIANEAADVFTYLDLLCERNGIDLGLSAARKFNEVSRRVGFPDRIEGADGEGGDL